MSEAWRKKRYYDPRVLVPVSLLTSTEIPDTLVCLSGAQVGLVRTLLQYATRRITWVSEYQEDHYLAPTTEEWDTIQAFTADLEGRLMSDCVTPLVEALDRIDATLAAQGATLSAIEGEIAAVASNVGDLLAPLQCICAKDPNITVTNIIDNDWPNLPNTEDVFEWGNQTPNLTIPSLVDEEACALAQCWYQAGYELLTEQFLPAWRFGFDDLLPAVAAAIAGFTGGIALPVVIGVYALAELIQELLEIAYESAEENLINWILAHKEDIVCPLYIGLRDGGSGAGLWQTVADEVVEPAVDLSAGDKVLVNFWIGIIGHVAARAAQTADSPWYQSVPVAGFCDTCPEEPEIGSDWVAVPVGETEGDISIDHPAGGYWAGSCFLTQVPAGFTVVGLLVEVVARSAGCEFKWMNGTTMGCGGAVSFTGNTSDQMPSVGWYYQHDDFTHNNNEVVATLAPGATQYGHGIARTGDISMSQGFQMGWNCTGSATAYIRYIVYAGTTPPP